MPAPRTIYTHFPLFISKNGSVANLREDSVGFSNATLDDGFVRIANLGGTGPVEREGYAGMVEHGGLDIGVPAGTPLLAPYNGTVIGNQGTGTCGWSVTIIDGFNRYRTVYCHMSAIEADILQAGSAGIAVKSGRRVGAVGGGARPGAGNASGTAPHLHIQTEVLDGTSNRGRTGWYISPLAYLNDFVNQPTRIVLRDGNQTEVEGARWKWLETSPGYPVPASQVSADAKNTVTQGPFLSADVKEKLDRVISGDAGNSPRVEAIRTSQTGVAFAEERSPTGISPYIATVDSFHPKIQYELTRRRMASETTNVHMPFVRLTSLTKVLGKNLDSTLLDRPGAWCPSLGVVGEPEVTFDDLLSPKSGRSTVGYATKVVRLVDNKPEYGRVPVLVETDPDTGTVLDDAKNIAPAGIVSMTAERSTTGPMGVRGGLFKANLKIVANSLGQFNALLRYFLRPGTRVVLEMGRESTSGTQQPITYFNWKQSQSTLENYFKSMITLRTGQRDMIESYIFNNFGNYEMFIGYVVTFKSKYTKNNTFEIDLTIHSVQQFEVPVKITGANSLCAGSSISDSGKAIDLDEYFKPESTTYKRNSFYKMLNDTQDEDSDLYARWYRHVIPLRGNGTDAPHAGTDQPGYLVSWKFFINVILRDPVYGIISVFQLNSQDDATYALLLGSLPPRIGEEATPSENNLQIRGNEAGYHQSLRSTNPGVMLLDNPNAAPTLQEKAAARTAIEIANEENKGSTPPTTPAAATVENRLRDSRSVVGQFLSKEKENVASLSSGVWINTNAIVDAFASTDVISNGLVKLLNGMNSATEGFWNLQLLSDEIRSPGVHIIDMGMSKPNNKKVVPNSIDTLVAQSTNSLTEDLRKFTKGTTGDEPKYLYVFNRATSIYEQDDIGGELLDISLESSLPQVIAVQAIAGVGGVAQRGTLEAIDINELRRISLINTYPKTCPPCTDGQPIIPPSPTLPAQDGIRTYEVKDEDGTAKTVAQRAILTDTEIQEITEAVRLARLATNADESRVATEDDIQNIIATRVEDILRQRYNMPAPEGFWENLVDVFSIPVTPAGYSLGGEIAVGKQEVDAALEAAKQEFIRTNGTLMSLIKEYAGAFGNALSLVALDRTQMIKEIEGDANQSPCSPTSNPRKVHPFSSSNLTKTTVDITLPGIGGIQLFQSFWVDRTPKILNSGYYVVTKISHDFSIDKGWTTKIQGRFRYQSSRDARRERREQASAEATQ